MEVDGLVDVRREEIKDYGRVFFKLIGRNSAEIGIQKGARRQSKCKPAVTGQPSGRPACTTCTGTAQSTTRSAVARRTVDRNDRPTGMPNILFGSVDLPVCRKDGSVDRSVGRQANLLLLLGFGLWF